MAIQGHGRFTLCARGASVRQIGALNITCFEFSLELLLCFFHDIVLVVQGDTDLYYDTIHGY